MKCYCVVLLTLWSWALTFEPQNSITSRVSQDLPYTKFEHFGIIMFLSYNNNNNNTSIIIIIIFIISSSSISSSTVVVS